MSFKILLSDGLQDSQHNLSCHNKRSTNVRCLFYSLCLSTSDWQCCSWLSFTTAGLRISPYMREKNWSVQMWRSIWSHQWSTSILTPRLEIYTDSLSSDSDESVTYPHSFFLAKSFCQSKLKTIKIHVDEMELPCQRKVQTGAVCLQLGRGILFTVYTFPLSPLILLSDVKSPQNLFIEETKHVQMAKPHKRHGHWKHLSVCLPRNESLYVLIQDLIDTSPVEVECEWRVQTVLWALELRRMLHLGKILSIWAQHLGLHIVFVFVLSADNVYYL